ncbi:hypothetical protein Bca4012_058607 [Brassica carinata]
MAENTFPLGPGSRNASGGGRGAVLAIDAKTIHVSYEEADSYWIDTCGAEVPPPEPWTNVRPRAERITGEPSRSTYPFLDTVRNFCQVPEDVVFRLPRDRERADAPPQGWFTLYEAQMMRSRLLFPIPPIVVEVINCFDVLISQISPSGLKHLIGLLTLSFKRGVNLSTDHVEAFLGLRRTSVDCLYVFKPRSYMEIVRGLPNDGPRRRECFFFIRLNGASVADECLPIFKCSWEGVGKDVGYLYYPIFIRS